MGNSFPELLNICILSTFVRYRRKKLFLVDLFPKSQKVWNLASAATTHNPVSFPLLHITSLLFLRKRKLKEN